MARERGRHAASPLEIPASGWRDIAWRVWHEFNDDRVLLFAAGATFYVLLSLVPAMTGMLALYGLVFDASKVGEHASLVLQWLSPEVRGVIEEQLRLITTTRPGALGVGFVASFAVALWGASSATKAMIDGLNIVYDEVEKRSFVKLSAVAVGFTFFVFIGVIGLIALASLIGMRQAEQRTSEIGLLVLVLVFVWAGIVFFYRWAPSRREAKWRWIMPGTLSALVSIALATVAFGWYARLFAGYSAYGSLGSVIAFMTYAWIGVTCVLLGAEINAEIEHQTARDSTTGRAKPMGARGATMADTIGKTAEAVPARPSRAPPAGRHTAETAEPEQARSGQLLLAAVTGAVLTLAVFRH